MSARVVRWSNVVCEMLSQRGTMSPSGEAKTQANGVAADGYFSDVLANLHLHREHNVGLERVVEIPDRCFSGL